MLLEMSVAIGLSSHQALQQLSRGIWKQLCKKQAKLETRGSAFSWMKDGFLHSSCLSTFPWTSCLLVLTEIIVLVICFSFDCTERSHYLPIEAFILFLILLCNIYMVGWDSVQRQREMWFRAEKIYETIQNCLNEKFYENWKIGNYPHLFVPQSPCISLQWTYRDGELVNLPLHLLVEGDHIVMRPGHPAPGSCKLVDESIAELALDAGDLFVPSSSESDLPTANSFQGNVRFRKPIGTALFVMLETPYHKALRLALKKSLDRPVTLFNRERHLVISCYLERMAIPIVILFIICVEILHTVYLSEENRHWAESLLLRPALAALPLLPLSLPFCWFVLNITGVAYLLAMTEIYNQAQRKTPMPLESYSEVDEDTTPASPERVVHWRFLRKLLRQLLFNQGGRLWRSSNLLQVLGSVTAFCCVDKKGILSWPNPSAEKVFFLRSTSQLRRSTDVSHQVEHFQHHHHYHHHNVSSDGQGIPSSLEDNAYFSTPSLAEKYDNRNDAAADDEYGESVDHFQNEPVYLPGTKAEVLDLTHSVSNDFSVQFDDPQWKKHITSLKPLGLSILLNTCNPAAQEHYAKFCDHVTCESLSNDAAVPVVNKRCLCELARQIGFTESAINTYQLQELLATFRHVQPELVRKGRLARTLNLSRLKMPFPYVSCAIIKDPHTGSHQLFSQGTGDLLVDTCSDYWDGKGLATLMESDRKRILDFYHRSSLTAYCMAFSYAPLGRPPQSGLDQFYLELPPEITQSLKKRLRHDSSGPGSPNRGRNLAIDESVTNHIFGNDFPLKPYLSTDSLLFTREAYLPQEELMGGPEQVKEDAFLEVLGNQIFIGMVTMQYQPCPDVVQLIELLDKACIRFVHFSKENELRSRVFSEKMGLESGWNCHISLLSEKTRSESGGSSRQQHLSWNSVQGLDPNPLTSSDSIQVGNDVRVHRLTAPLRCVSAPSLVNLETFTVRFEDEVSLFSSRASTDNSDNEFGPSSQHHSVVFRNDDENILPPGEGTELQPLTDCIAPLLITSHARNNHEEPSHRQRLNSSTPLRGSTLSQSPSRVTESTEQSVPITFDMSNRAKLPKGIENIRPHLEQVDNVPLLVSLFTDCTPEATEEMIRIMQEYGEVVACIGSSSNVHNIPIFLQADVSIGVEPLFPQLCRNQPVFSCENGIPGKKDSKNASLDSKLDPSKITPTELSRQLNILPCAFGIHRDDPISLYHLIMEARHLTSSMQNSLQFMLCCSLSLSLLQLLCDLFFLPPPLGVSHLMWLVCLQVPLLSLSLLGNPCDRQIMATATGKNLKIVSKQTILFFLGCYGIKFCPSVMMIMSAFGASVAHFCRNALETKIPPLGKGACWIFLHTEGNTTERSVIHSSPFTSPTAVWTSSLTLCQNLVSFLIVIYFVVISAGFVHRMHLLWERNPFRNRCWAFVCLLVLILQFLFCMIDITAYAEHEYIPVLLKEIPYYVWIVVMLWPLPLILINALIKRHEIKINVRQQKRVRLEFGTKLGMNSPF